MLFFNPFIRAAYVDLYGTSDDKDSPFKLNQVVVFAKTYMGGRKEIYVGKIEALNRVGAWNWEYLIEGCPHLAWETELAHLVELVDDGVRS